MGNGERAEAAEALAKAGVADVSRETIERLTGFVELLREWQRAKNLVAAGTLDAVWTRHVGDSAQLRSLAPTARRWLDLGSGAGFPGIVMAALLAEVPDAAVHLVESNGRKAAFLNEAGWRLDLPAVVHRRRIEDVIAAWDEPVDAISARALAPMPVLAAWLQYLLEAGVPAYLHKGLDFRAEWEATPDRDRLVMIEHPSRFGGGVIAELRAAAASSELR